MKPIEEAFSSGGFRRVILPGILITAGVHPVFSHLTSNWLRQYALSEPALLLAAEVLLFGLIISSSTNRIYYVYEGFSLPWLTSPARAWNQRRLATSLDAYKKLLAGGTYESLSDADKIRAALLDERLSDYPLRLTGNQQYLHYVDSSTLLGNIIATYELYAKTRYHVDGVFYWFHLRALAPQEITKEFDDTYAFAESLVVTSFAGAVIAFINAFVLAALFLGGLFPGIVMSQLNVTALGVTALMALGLAVCALFYYLALPAHREAGKILRTIVDLSVGKLREWADGTPAPIDTAAVARLAARKRYLNSMKK